MSWRQGVNHCVSLESRVRVLLSDLPVSFLSSGGPWGWFLPAGAIRSSLAGVGGLQSPGGRPLASCSAGHSAPGTAAGFARGPPVSWDHAPTLVAFGLASEATSSCDSQSVLAERRETSVRRARRHFNGADGNVSLGKLSNIEA